MMIPFKYCNFKTLQYQKEAISFEIASFYNGFAQSSPNHHQLASEPSTLGFNANYIVTSR